jgi:O-methyltransferase
MPTPPQSDSAPSGALADDLRERYLELLKRSVTHSLYPAGSDAVGYPPRNPLKRWLLARMRRRGIVALRRPDDGERERAEGRDWPLFGQTMVGFARLDNLRSCIETVLADGISGDLIEAGTWRGGASIYARGVLRAHGVIDRTVYLADSFRGLPAPNPERSQADAGATWHLADHLAAPIDDVRESFRRYDLLDHQVVFLEGWFRDTLPEVRGHPWAVIRLDADMYESTTDALANLYPSLAPGGFLIVDDYLSVDACRQAVEDYRAAEGITDSIEEIDWTGVFWRKSG